MERKNNFFHFFPQMICFQFSSKVHKKSPFNLLDYYNIITYFYLERSLVKKIKTISQSKYI